MPPDAPALFRNFDLGVLPLTIGLMAGKIRTWLDGHPNAKIALWLVELVLGLMLALALVQLVPRLITGNWCP